MAGQQVRHRSCSGNLRARYCYKKLTHNNRTNESMAPIGIANRLFFWGQVVFFRSLFALYFRFKITGPPVPSNSPFILAANHESLIDPVVLQVGVKHRVHYLMTSDYYYKPVLNWYSRVMRCIPVMEDAFNRDAIRCSLKMLASGRSIGIFPQGGLRPGNDFSEAMNGVALLALKSGANVVPARLVGTGKAMPKGALMARPSKIELRLGKAIEVNGAKTHSKLSKHDQLERLTARLMDSISQL